MSSSISLLEGQNPPLMDLCQGVTKKGHRCKRKATPGQAVCNQHMGQPEECAICYERSPLTYVLPCTHKFHPACFESWANRRRQHVQDVTCPLCRYMIEPRQQSLSIDMGRMIQLLRQMFPFPTPVIEQMAHEMAQHLQSQ